MTETTYAIQSKYRHPNSVWISLEEEFEELDAARQFLKGIRTIQRQWRIVRVEITEVE